MFHTAQLLDRTETTMVVGENQSLIRNGNTRTSSSEDHDGIGNTRVGFTVQLFVRGSKSQLLHPCQVLFIQLFQYPHALIGKHLA